MAKSIYFPTITQKLKNGYNKRRCPQHLFQCILYGLLVHWLSTFLGSNLNPDREYLYFNFHFNFKYEPFVFSFFSCFVT